MNNATPRRRAGPFGRAFVVLAGEAFGGQIAERRSAAVAPSTGSGQAAVGVVVVGGQGVAGLVDKGAARLQVVLQQVEDTVIGAIAMLQINQTRQSALEGAE